MSYTNEMAYPSGWTLASHASTDERASFIAKTYFHLAGAVLAFVAIEAALLSLPNIDGMMQQFLPLLMGYGWLLVFGAFMLVSMIANRMAVSAVSPAVQYAGLGLYVVAEAVIFLPLLYIAARFAGPDVIPTAGLITLLLFGAMTVIVLATRKNFSFLAPMLGVASFAAIGLILCSMLFGFSLGIFFTVAMIVVMCGYILYYTSNVVHEYHIGQHIAAALALFASLATLFWYVLQFVMHSSSDD